MNAPRTVSSPLSAAIANYLALKQALGRRFAVERRVLADLERFLAVPDSAYTTLSSEAFASWCLTLTHLCPTTRRNRMRIVRNFCLYLRRTDPDCFVPDLAAFPAPQPPQRPYIFSEEDIVRLLQVANEIPPRSTSPLRGAGLRLAVVLLYTAGLRRGELVRLALSDYNPVEQTLLVRASKFHKSRLVALSADAAREMQAYLVLRRRFPHDAAAPLLVSAFRGLRARSGAGLGHSLRQLFQRAGLRSASGRVPRVHDLRHYSGARIIPSASRLMAESSLILSKLCQTPMLDCSA